MEADSSMFMQWAMDTLLSEHPEPASAFLDGCGGETTTTFPSLQALRDASHAVEMVRELMADDEAHAANSWSSGDGDLTDGSTVPAMATSRTTAARDCNNGSWTQSPGSFRRAPPAPPSSSGTSTPAVSWNFITGSAQPGSGAMIEEAAAPRSLPPELLVPASPPTRRPSLKSLGAAASSASYAPDHIIAERKRREKINKRLIELSTVIPGLKKMDKATILSDAAKYVKELQQRLKDFEEAAARSCNNETMARAKKQPCNAAVAAADENGSSASSGTPVVRPPPALPEIQARFSEKSVMVRVHCRSGKGVATTVLSEVEELGLSVVHANVMPFSACTVIVTITAKVDEGFTLTAEEIVGSLNSALSNQHSSCNKGTEETGN